MYHRLKSREFSLETSASRFTWHVVIFFMHCIGFYFHVPAGVHGQACAPEPSTPERAGPPPTRLVKGQCTCSSGFSTGLSHRVGWCFKWDSSLAERVSVRSGFHFPAQNATWTMTWCQEQGLSDRLHLTPAQA